VHARVSLLAVADGVVAIISIRRENLEGLWRLRMQGELFGQVAFQKLHEAVDKQLVGHEILELGTTRDMDVDDFALFAHERQQTFDALVPGPHSCRPSEALDFDGVGGAAGASAAGAVVRAMTARPPLNCPTIGIIKGCFLPG